MINLPCRSVAAKGRGRPPLAQMVSGTVHLWIGLPPTAATGAMRHRARAQFIRILRAGSPARPRRDGTLQPGAVLLWATPQDAWRGRGVAGQRSLSLHAGDAWRFANGRTHREWKAPPGRCRSRYAATVGVAF